MLGPAQKAAAGADVCENQSPPISVPVVGRRASLDEPMIAIGDVYSAVCGRRSDSVVGICAGGGMAVKAAAREPEPVPQWRLFRGRIETAAARCVDM